MAEQCSTRYRYFSFNIKCFDTRKSFFEIYSARCVQCDCVFYFIEYGINEFSRWITKATKGCPGYDTRLYLMVRILFLRAEECGVTLHGACACVWGVLPICRGVVGVFYSPSQLGCVIV